MAFKSLYNVAPAATAAARVYAPSCVTYTYKTRFTVEHVERSTMRLVPDTPSFFSDC